MPTKKMLLGTWLLLLCTGFLYAQTKPVTGKITDSVSGSPLQGVVISILNGKKSVVTNEKGEFSLVVPEFVKRILQISYVGFSTQTVSIGEASHVSIQLIPNTKKEDEIVVVAYGSQRKSSLTSSVATVNPIKFTGWTSCRHPF
jgi:TonB-dependent starch-binding outer membrane protein SusC